MKYNLKIEVILIYKSVTVFKQKINLYSGYFLQLSARLNILISLSKKFYNYE